MKHRASFTLIELLVVIGIVAILSVVVVTVLNPAQMLRQARDSNRLSDLNTLTKAVSLFETDQAGASVGSASTTYFSVVDPSATSTNGTHCQGTGLPGAPSGWTYRCPASSTLRKTDGTGWIPVNFDQMSFKALSALPVDPVNTTSSGQYYSYTPGGSFALTATLESDKYLRDKAVNDAGYDPGKYETGSDLALVARSQGLVGWWKLDNETGDWSGKGNNGTLNLGTSTANWQASSSCKIGTCLQFDGGDDYVAGMTNSSLRPGRVSFTAWVKLNSVNRSVSYIGGAGNTGYDGYLMYAYATGNTGFRLGMGDGANVIEPSVSNLSAGQWYFLTGTYDGSNVRIYKDGQLQSTGSLAGTIGYGSVNEFVLGYSSSGGSDRYLPGLLDDVRVYSRALSGKEIEAIYNAMK